MRARRRGVLAPRSAAQPGQASFRFNAPPHWCATWLTLAADQTPHATMRPCSFAEHHGAKSQHAEVRAVRGAMTDDCFRPLVLSAAELHRDRSVRFRPRAAVVGKAELLGALPEAIPGIAHVDRPGPIHQRVRGRERADGRAAVGFWIYAVASTCLEQIEARLDPGDQVTDPIDLVPAPAGRAGALCSTGSLAFAAMQASPVRVLPEPAS